MTKAKKKMNKSTFVIIIMAVAMVAMLAFGGTFAYFTASAKNVTATATTGTIALTSGEKVTLTGNTSTLLPGESVQASLTYSDSSNRGTWIVVSASATSTELGKDAKLEISNITSSTTGITITKYTKTTGDVPDVIYLIENSKATDSSSASTSSDEVAANSIQLSVSVTFDATEENVEGSETTLSYMGKTFTITFSAKSIQHSGIDASTALTELGYTGYTNSATDNTEDPEAEQEDANT